MNGRRENIFLYWQAQQHLTPVLVFEASLISGYVITD